MSKYGASLYNFLFNSFNSAIVIINGIIMVPIYFHYFPVSVYGAWLASGNLIAMIGLLESGFSSVITQKMAAAINKGDNTEYRTLAGANIISAGILSIVIFLIALCLAPFIADIVNVEDEYASDITWAFILSALSSAIMIFVLLFGAFPQVWQETKQVGTINTICNIVAIASLVLYLLLGFGVISLGLSYVTRSTLNLIWQGQWIYSRHKKKSEGDFIFSLNRVWRLTKDCFYPFLSRLANVFMTHSTSLILAAFLNPSLAAIYDLTAKITLVLMGFLNMANGSFFALFSLTLSKGDKLEAESVINKVTCFVSCLIVGALIFATCFSKPFINLWVGLDKFGGDWLLIAIVFSYAIAQYKSFFNNLLFSAGLINKSSILDIGCLITYFLSLLVTLDTFEQYAIPMSMGFTNLCFVWLYINLQKKYLQLNISRALGYLIKSITYPCVIIAVYMVIQLSVSDYIAQAVFFAFAILFYFSYILMNKESRQITLLIFNKIVNNK